MWIITVRKYQATIKKHDQGQNHWIKSIVSFISLWWEDINVKKGCWALVQKGRAGVSKVVTGIDLGQKVSKRT